MKWDTDSFIEFFFFIIVISNLYKKNMILNLSRIEQL